MPISVVMAFLDISNFTKRKTSAPRGGLVILIISDYEQLKLYYRFGMRKTSQAQFIISPAGAPSEPSCGYII